MDEPSAPGESPGRWIRRADREDAERHADPMAVVLHEAILIQGERELGRPVSPVAWSGLAAGLTMGLSMVAEGVLRTRLPRAAGPTWSVRSATPQASSSSRSASSSSSPRRR